MRTKQRIRGMRWGAAALFAVVILLGPMGSQRVPADFHRSHI